jgi:ethanolamine-phosphate cytidylyltransferase
VKELEARLEGKSKKSVRISAVEKDRKAEKATEKNEKKEIRLWMDGAFDMMHYGHMNAFRQARSLGTYLIAGVNSDETITACKGRPVCDDKERIDTVRGCKWVDEVSRPCCSYADTWLVCASDLLSYQFKSTLHLGC